MKIPIASSRTSFRISSHPRRNSRGRRWLAGHRWLSVLLLLAVLSSACSTQLATQVAEQMDKAFPSIIEPTRAPATRGPTETPFQPVGPTPTRTITPTPTPVPVRELTVWLDSSLPNALAEQVSLPQDTRRAESPDQANLNIGALRGGDFRSDWVYALVTPFPTTIDGVDGEEILRAWRGEEGQVFFGPLLIAENTRAAFEARWGAPNDRRVETLAEDQILEAAWSNRPAWALVPFEVLEPRWKVLRVDGHSPLDREMDVNEYPLTVWFGVSGSAEALQLLRGRMGEQVDLLPATNRDLDRMTTLVMTGVTALTRATAYKMDALGATYPARDIQDWLREADLTHISNEVSFNPECPPGNPLSTSTMFCSRPQYIELLDFIGTDVIELSGNHNNDYGRQWFNYSLDLYAERGWPVYAGGTNMEAARRPAVVEHNGNRLAFIGCNPVGPPGVWATETEPGAASCEDYDWLLAEINRLREEGYLPIVTFQYFEIYVYTPSDHQMDKFRAAAKAGAVIVSGSQAHYPQTMEFYEDAFVHYGLGNLFFDQMDVPVAGTRNEFVDRHVFYDGRHISTELLTALLEDFARPRPMEEAERRSFLADVFQAGGW